MIPLTIHEFEIAFHNLSQELPLELFAFGGSLLEEVISPIPGYLVMGIIGSLAFAQKLGPWNIAFLILLGAFGKTLGAALYYFIGDTLEDVFRGTLSRFFRVSPGAIENFGKRFTGAHWKDGGLIFLLRLFPLTPATPFSLVCGVLKIQFGVYFLGTFLGNFCKDIIYVLLGYYGVANIHRLAKDIQWYKVELEFILTFVALGAFLILFFQSDIWKNQKRKISLWRQTINKQ